ncbi:MAG: M23 family metallopeptidase [Crocinitomicaceae bacterium]|nr:M23 family metallopeptidase [Crocinitomicaceae bacterium]
MFKQAVFILLLVPVLLFGQSTPNYKSYNFRAPMDIPLILAGNFAELRSNHFHTGIDIKTGGVEGQNLYSIEEGYVSRIKISPWGYGKVIYIDHPNGFTSVYAHCQKFSDRFEKIMYEKMQKENVNELDAFFTKDEIKVKKGEMIALSGNTGGSVAPHLHFEIRETKTEKPLNPLLFNFNIHDHKKPEIRGLKVYALTENNYIVPNKSRYIYASQNGSSYQLNEKLIIDEGDFPVNGKLGFAVDVIDRLDGANNICGIFESHISCNSSELYSFKFDKLDFGKNRMINGHTDVYEFKENRRDLHKLFSNPATTLENYEGKINGIDLRDLLDSNQLTIIAKDQNSNTTSLNSKFYFQKNAPLKLNWENFLMPHDTYAERNSEFELFLPGGTIFEPIEKDYSSNECKWDTTTTQYHFGNYNTPVNNKVHVRLKIDNKRHSKKLVICRANMEEDYYYAIGGEINEGWIETEVKGLGDFFVLEDTVAPEISPNNFRDGQLVSRDLKIKVEDNLSGIQKYETYCNGVFIPGYFTAKKSTYEIPFEKINVSGDFELKVVAYDAVGNKSEKVFRLKK